MNDFSHLPDAHPLVGDWLHIASGGGASNIIHISNDVTGLSVSVKAYTVDDAWKNYIEIEEKVSVEVSGWDNTSVSFVAWYESVGRKTYRTISKFDRKLNEIKRISKISSQYSGTSNLNRVSVIDEENPLSGIWRPEDDDHWSQYEIKEENDELKILAMNYATKKPYKVENIIYAKNQIEFEAEYFISERCRRIGKYVFCFLPVENKAIVNYSFIEFGYLQRI